MSVFESEVIFYYFAWLQGRDVTRVANSPWQVPKTHQLEWSYA